MSIEIEIVAFIASTIGVSGCIPQIHKILKTKDTEAISYGKYIMCALSSFLWVFYGSMVGTYSIMFWNSFSIIMAFTVVFLRYNQERKKAPDIDLSAFKTYCVIDTNS
jgi:MtN3 and saliva related transmembrane protein